MRGDVERALAESGIQLIERDLGPQGPIIYVPQYRSPAPRLILSRQHHRDLRRVAIIAAVGHHRLDHYDEPAWIASAPAISTCPGKAMDSAFVLGWATGCGRRKSYEQWRREYLASVIVAEAS